MALTKEIPFYQFTIPAYVKIGGVQTIEEGDDEEGKIYTANLQVDWYTDNTKEYHYSQSAISLSGLREYQLQLSVLYDKLALLPEFEGFISC